MNSQVNDGIPLNDLISNPDYYLWRFDGPNSIFARMTRASYKQSIFTDQRIIAAHPKPLRVDTDLLAEAFRNHGLSQPRLAFIFHVAHCGSTLLARALDIEGKNVVYREPPVLRQLALILAENNWPDSPPELWSDALAMATGLLNKSYQSATPPIIKANVPVNFILSDLMKIAPASSGILLYSTFENYLLSILKSDNHKQWVATIHNKLSSLIQKRIGLDKQEQQNLSHAECAASLWLTQLLIFKEFSEKYSDLKTLDSEIFFSDPTAVLSAAFTLFDISVTPNEVSKIVESELFTSHAKMPSQQYNNEKRLNEKQQLTQNLASELKEARVWLEKILEKLEFTNALANPLLGESPTLIETNNISTKKSGKSAQKSSSPAPYACFEATDSSNRLDDIRDEQIIEALKNRGVILLRGFDYKVENFTRFVNRFCHGSAFNPSHGRDVVDKKNNIQTVDLGTQAFPLHAELCREPWKPDICFFACQSSPEVDGETTICDGVKIVAGLKQDTIRQLQAQPLLYFQAMLPEDSMRWLGTDRPTPELVQNPPASCPFEMTYLEGKLCRVHTTAALHRTMFSKQLSFGNFLLFSRYGLNNRLQPCFADGSIVPDELVAEVKQVSDELTYAHKWQDGDILVLDNTRYLHGRRKINDVEERRILSYFGYLNFAELDAEESTATWRQK